MRITVDHPASRYGVPVILDDDGELLDDDAGVRAVRRRLGLSTAQLGAACGRSRRTVEAWESGRYRVPAEALTVMARLLDVGPGAARDAPLPPPRQSR